MEARPRSLIITSLTFLRDPKTILVVIEDPATMSVQKAGMGRAGVSHTKAE